jgi:hypothetical protein
VLCTTLAVCSMPGPQITSALSSTFNRDTLLLFLCVQSHELLLCQAAETSAPAGLCHPLIIRAGDDLHRCRSLVVFKAIVSVVMARCVAEITDASTARGHKHVAPL